MNDLYQQFLRKSESGIPIEIAVVATAESAVVSVCLKGEYKPSPRPAMIMAYLRPDVPTGRLLIHFLRRSICRSSQSRPFAENCFTASGQLLSPGVIRALGWEPGKYQLAKGHYPILEDADYYTVSARVGRSVSSSLKQRVLPGMKSKVFSIPTPIL